jgi:hypothetical protein
MNFMKPSNDMKTGGIGQQAAVNTLKGKCISPKAGIEIVLFPAKEVKRTMSSFLSALLVLLLVSASGCRRAGRETDTASIKSNFVGFRNAIIARDLGKANEFLAPSYQPSSPPEKLFVTFQEITEPKTALTSNSWVDFKSCNTVFLYPQSKPRIGAVAYEFERTTNGWLLTGNWMYVEH